jgi:hypothetical protein
MIIEFRNPTSDRAVDTATREQLGSISEQGNTGHFTLVLALALVVLALAWGLYESVMLLTGVIPKF